MDVLNIAKIKDGLFIGDKTVGTNLSILMQFKITHLVNTAGNQIPFTFETAGIKYLTFNWVENPSNNVIYIKDETARKLLTFVDNSLQRGSGIMIFSVKGQNRACVAIILYLMKKYNWSLKKCKEYLSTKKRDISIKKNYISQLTSFEERLNKNNNILINDWINNNNLKDRDELLMNNTYLNEKELTKKKYLINKKKENIENNKINENNEIINKKPHIEWADHINPNNFGKNSLISKCEISKDLYFQKKFKPITNHIKMKPKKSCIKSYAHSKENLGPIIFPEYNKKIDNKQIIIAQDKKLIKEEKNPMNTQVLKNKFFVENKPGANRKLTYDNKDNDKFIFKENMLDNFDHIIDNEKKILKNLFKDEIKNNNENEKNNNYINEDKKRASTSISENKDKKINFDRILDLDNNQEIDSNILNSEKKINNFMGDNKYSLYFQNSFNNTKRGSSARKPKKNNTTTKLLQNKKYYLGQPNSKNSKKSKENEKDNNIIPTISHSSTFQTLNYEYNLNFHNNKMLIRSLINNQEIKNNINNSQGGNNSYFSNKKKKRQINSLELKNNRYKDNDSNSIYKPKNANIFNKFNSYNFHPSEPVKIKNNITYRLSHSLDKNNNSIKIFNNVNNYDEISKGINISNTKIYKHNRPLSAQKNMKNKNNNYFNNTNGFSSNSNEFLKPQNRAPSPMIQEFDILKNISHYNNNHNNRYNFSKPMNNIGNEKKSFKKKL